MYIHIVIDEKHKVSTVRKHRVMKTCKGKLNIQSMSVQYLTVSQRPHKRTKYNQNRTVLKVESCGR
jgi:hypothetical protein